MQFVRLGSNLLTIWLKSVRRIETKNVSIFFATKSFQQLKTHFCQMRYAAAAKKEKIEKETALSF